MGAHDIGFSLRLPKNRWNKLSSDDPAGCTDLEEGDQTVIS